MRRGEELERVAAAQARSLSLTALFGSVNAGSGSSVAYVAIRQVVRCRSGSDASSAWARSGVLSGSGTVGIEDLVRRTQMRRPGSRWQDEAPPHGQGRRPFASAAWVVMSPWQVVQPTPLGRARCGRNRRSRAACRPASSGSACRLGRLCAHRRQHRWRCVQSCEWQVMQVGVGGMPAKAAMSRRPCGSSGSRGRARRHDARG